MPTNQSNRTRRWCWLELRRHCHRPTLCRSSTHPKQFLKDFKGFLHTDGYAAYHTHCLKSPLWAVGFICGVNSKMLSTSFQPLKGRHLQPAIQSVCVLLNKVLEWRGIIDR
ncbi:IS66 family transposase [Sporomusa sphaeroides]|uniref:IS66 family transposase n=1 Tax=Sporomusa sphaeroides TaxID=47679 RepID=UPI003CC910DF